VSRCIQFNMRLAGTTVYKEALQKGFAHACQAAVGCAVWAHPDVTMTTWRQRAMVVN